MTRLTLKIAVPIILVGVFAVIVFISVGYENLNPGFYIIVAFLFIYVFFFGLAVGQSLSSPVKKLLDKATELSKGNLSSRVYLETKDEFAELAKVFNEIAEELSASREQEVNLEKSVGLKVKARTEELEETISALEQKVKNRTIELERLIEESNKLQEEAKSKGLETSQLKKELNDFKQKVSKYGKPRQKSADSDNV